MTMTNDKLDRLEQEATRLAIRWAKTGFAFNTMEQAVNDFMEAIGANRAIGNDPEAIRLGREAAVLRINVNAIHALDKQQEQRLHDTLIDIAQRGVPRQRRGWRR